MSETPRDASELRRIALDRRRPISESMAALNEMVERGMVPRDWSKRLLQAVFAPTAPETET